MRTRQTVSNQPAIYHCMSRTVNGEAFFGDREKEILRKMIAQVADFSGVEVLTYCVMSNHFHVLVRVTPPLDLPDSELIRRFGVLYPKPTDYQPASIDDLTRILKAGGEPAAALRKQFLGRMGNISEFMKTLKQRFSVWYNKSHDRFGPVWSDRYKSVLVEGKGFPLQTMAAYIDLNPVRAGLVNDPKDYRFCGYAEAVAGNSTSLAGIQAVAPDARPLSQAEAMQSYRQLLFGKGGAAVVGGANISRKDALRVLEKENGVLPLADLLRCRVRYFTDGAILGSAEFVRSHLESWQKCRRRKHSPDVHAVAGEGSDIKCINHGRGAVFS